MGDTLNMGGVGGCSSLQRKHPFLGSGFDLVG